MAASLKHKVAVGLLTLSAGGLAFISGQEGRSLHAYRDVVGIVTICDGHTRTAKAGQVATDAICDDLLRQDTAVAQAAVRRLVEVPVTQGQYDALVSFTFNLGEGNLASSTLLKRINANQCMAAGAEFPRWNKAQGREFPGLTKRRALERALWEAGC